VNLFLPNNIFSNLLVKSLPEDKNLKKNYFPAAVLTFELSKDKSAVALVPSFDLLKNKDLYVSSKFGLSFEGNLSNSYFYFKNKADIKKLSITGDVSSTEVLLSKIIFKEEYEIDVNVEISQTDKKNDLNSLIIGNGNFVDYKMKDGFSLSEKLSDFIGFQYPFVNYVLVSFEEENLKYFDDKAEQTQNKIYDLVEKDEVINSFNNESKNFIKENISSLIVNLESQDREGLLEILKLPYYHGIIKYIVDVKFI